MAADVAIVLSSICLSINKRVYEPVAVNSRAVGRAGQCYGRRVTPAVVPTPR